MASSINTPAATWDQKIRAITLAAAQHSDSALQSVNLCLERGVEHMEFKDPAEFDCSGPEEYIFAEAEHLIDELDLQFEQALATVLRLDQSIACVSVRLRGKDIVGQGAKLFSINLLADGWQEPAMFLVAADTVELAYSNAMSCYEKDGYSPADFEDGLDGYQIGTLTAF